MILDIAGVDEYSAVGAAHGREKIGVVCGRAHGALLRVRWYSHRLIPLSVAVSAVPKPDPQAVSESPCVLVNSLAGGGGEKVALRLYASYHRLGVAPVLVCMEKNSVYAIDDANVVYLSRQTGKNESGLTKLLSLWVFARRLKRFVREHNITLVQSHIYRANYVNLLSRWLGSRCRVQIVNHGIASRYRQQGLLGKVNLFLLRWLYPKADQLVCPSRGMLEDLASLGAVCADNRVIGNPFTVDAILQQSREAVASTRFAFDENKRYLISVGRLEAVKRPRDIVRALAELSDIHPELELIFLGQGEEQSALQDLADTLGVTGRVHFPGHVDNPYAFVAHADVFVSASEFEGFSNVIVESLIAGTAVVASDCPSGPREILAPDSEPSNRLQPGETEKAEFGLLYAVGDVDGMSEAIDQLLADSQMRQEYEQKGLQRARDFEQDKIARLYMEGWGR